MKNCSSGHAPPQLSSLIQKLFSKPLPMVNTLRFPFSLCSLAWMLTACLMRSACLPGAPGLKNAVIVVNTDSDSDCLRVTLDFSFTSHLTDLSQFPVSKHLFPHLYNTNTNHLHSCHEDEETVHVKYLPFGCSPIFLYNCILTTFK